MSAPYSERWAADIVDLFLENHARATKIVALVLDRDLMTQKRKLVEYLRFAPKRWNTAKRWYKRINASELDVRFLLRLSRKDRVLNIRGVVFPDLDPQEWVVVRLFDAIDVDVVDRST